MNLDVMYVSNEDFFSSAQDAATKKRQSESKRQPLQDAGAATKFKKSMANVALAGVAGACLTDTPICARDVYENATGTALTAAAVECVRHHKVLRQPVVKSWRKMHQHPVATTLFCTALVGLLGQHADR